MRTAETSTMDGAHAIRAVEPRQTAHTTRPMTGGPTSNATHAVPSDAWVSPTAGRFKGQVPEFHVDLDRPASERWNEVIAATKGPTLALVREAAKEMELLPRPLRYLVGLAYRVFRFPHADEIAAIARGYGLPVGTVTLLNWAYALSHLPRGHQLGCTAATAYTQSHGMVHVRTLDWPLENLGPATCVLRMHKKGREHVVVGVPGQVGVLSGMKPGGYSVTINWAPPGRLPSLREDPTFLLRRVLETCDSYDEAVAMLRDTPLATSVFFTVCGVRHGEACVIERTKDDAVVRGASSDTVVQANHHEAPRFVANNANAGALEGVQFLEESGERSRVLDAAMRERDASLLDFIAALDRLPVLNKDTVQKMVLFPASGRVAVWRLIPPSSAW